MENKKTLTWSYKTIDPWQKELLNVKGNFILLCGRQVGKSEIVAFIEALYLLNTPKAHICILSGKEGQATGLFNKIFRFIEAQHSDMISTGKDKPLRTVFKLTNGSICRTEPVGTDGASARQHTLTRVVFEEMQLIPEEAFGAVTPMLLTTGGDIHMLGTAWATEGYVYERLSDPSFTVVRVNSEEVAQMRSEPSRTIMLNFLEQEKKRLTSAVYAQEYLAIPSDKVRQIYPDSLIKRAMSAKRQFVNNYAVCGVDPAGLGEDEGAISIFTKEENDKFIQREFIVTNKLYTWQTSEKIKELDKQWKFKKIYVDDGGVGFGVFSDLIKDPQTAAKTLALNNATRPLDWDKKKQKGILKHDLYFNLLSLMEKGKVSLLEDDKIRESLKSCRFEIDEETKKLKIVSTYNHPVESIIRAVWEEQNKSLKLWLSYSGDKDFTNELLDG